MKMQKSIIFISLVFTIVLLMTSCNAKVSNFTLPNPYTFDNIETAFLEYINFRLWYYPAEYSDRQPSDFFFDDYIGQDIEAEIRVYHNPSELKQTEEEPIVCISTNITQQLAMFTHKEGLVYCDGLVKDSNNSMTESKNYTVIKKFNFVIPEVRLPNFGTSVLKDKMIQMAEEAVISDCRDWISYGDENGISFKNANVYISNFYEYESPQIYICKQNETVLIYPIIFEIKNGDIRMTKMTAYTIEDIQLNTLVNYQFGLDKGSAIRRFKINE